MKKNTPNDIFHFENFVAGSEKAFEYFFRKYYNHVLGFSINILNDEKEAEHIAQEAFVNLWMNRGRIEKCIGIESFLYTYAKSKCLNCLRHQKVKKRYVDDSLNAKEQQLNHEVLKSMEFDAFDLVELKDLIQQAIDNLPRQTKIIFEKKRFQEKMNKQIAEELGVSVKTVEAHITKALKSLRLSLSSYLPIFLLAFLFNS
ncbi:RNA polymerase sigma-70 factor [Wenyingzhuangia sp. chi5]|uniref:RNA polymerase sigma-70 factor n=1 Tax=Wenyingzhuangia gilva TaxID=3057677 RepID=A0ABT8VT90_9FLAO|nr:RNA polymerase sigma-70 factor [Wenyingzhuangia sp. chi5]MDO3695155.1 RNA polymerase sigma-70 factor [Wenyingzhuangia sp. chi5]